MRDCARDARLLRFRLRARARTQMTNAWNKRTEMSERLSKLEDQMKNTATPEEVKAIQSEVDALRKEYDESFSTLFEKQQEHSIDIDELKLEKQSEMFRKQLEQQAAEWRRPGGGARPCPPTGCTCGTSASSAMWLSAAWRSSWA